MLFGDPKKKPALLTIIGVGPKAGPPPTEDEPVRDNSIALKSAVEELWRAYDTRDVVAGVSALKSFIELCDDYDDDEEDDKKGDEQADGGY